MTPRVAILVPCYNEEAAIATVVQDFRAALGAAPEQFQKVRGLMTTIGLAA